LTRDNSLNSFDLGKHAAVGRTGTSVARSGPVKGEAAMNVKVSSVVSAAIVALAVAGPTGAAVDRKDMITIPGTLISSDGGKLIIRTDDHGHRMPFDVGTSTALPEGLRKGTHVSVTYHPLGPTGQAADEVQVIAPGAPARSQAAFRVVTGPADTRVTAR
jgi:hypothetical protein